MTYSIRYLWIALTAYSLIAVTSHAQNKSDIVVRLISTVSGKPIEHRGVLIYQINPDTHMPIAEQGFPLKGSTDDEGRVVFSSLKLHSPSSEGLGSTDDSTQKADRKNLSKMLDIEIVYAGGGIQCSTGLFSLAEILQSGVVGDNHCKQKIDPVKFKIKPGEVIIFVGKYHWWDAGQT